MREADFTLRAAQLWQRILRVDNATLFKETTDDVRDRAHGFDRLPQPGFIGSQYRCGGLLLLGQNPGNDPIGKGMSAPDRLQYGYLGALRDADNSAKAVAAFNSLTEILTTLVMPNWAIVRRVVRPLLYGLGMDLKHIAYTNLVKFRTDDSGFAKTLCEKSWELTSAQIDLLSPSVIVALGVGAHKEFTKRYRGQARVYKVTRGIGDKHLPATGAADIAAICVAERDQLAANR